MNGKNTLTQYIEFLTTGQNLGSSSSWYSPHVCTVYSNKGSVRLLRVSWGIFTVLEVSLGFFRYIGSLYSSLMVPSLMVKGSLSILWIPCVFQGSLCFFRVLVPWDFLEFLVFF